MTGELFNRCGYWFFPHSVELPDVLAAGQSSTVTVVWQNRGVARALIRIRCSCGWQARGKREVELPSGNTRWLPAAAQKTSGETYALAVPVMLPPGDYDLKSDSTPAKPGRDVKLPVQNPTARHGSFLHRRPSACGQDAGGQHAKRPQPRSGPTTPWKS